MGFIKKFSELEAKAKTRGREEEEFKKNLQKFKKKNLKLLGFFAILDFILDFFEIKYLINLCIV